MPTKMAKALWSNFLLRIPLRFLWRKSPTCRNCSRAPSTKQPVLPFPLNCVQLPLGALKLKRQHLLLPLRQHPRHPRLALNQRQRPQLLLPPQ